MIVRSKFLLLVCVAALFTAACSSTTSVARDNRVVTDEQTQDATDTTDIDADTDGSGNTDSSPDDATDEADAEDTTDSPDGEPTTAPPRAVEEDSGFGAGGEEQIQGLVDDCEADSDMACDILFQISDFDSVEETIALTCGGRSDIEMLFCTEGVAANEGETSFDIESEALPGLATACEEGDMTACDFLFYRSPVDSELESLGNTCGGRTSVGLPDCRTFFADE